MRGDAVTVMMGDESDDCRDVVRYWHKLQEGHEGGLRESLHEGRSCCWFLFICLDVWPENYLSLGDYKKQ